MFEEKILSRALEAFFNLPASFPRHAQIAITNLCNLECPMCFRYFINVERKHMDYNVFKKVIDKLKGVSLVTLSGYGEPFCYPEIFEAIKYCIGNGFKVELTSNGLLLNDDGKIKELITSGLDAITFSLESVRAVNDITHRNQGTLNNIKRLIELKQELNSKTPSVTIQTLMIKDRQEDLFDVIKWGALNGVERINVARFEQLNTLTDVERPNIEEEKEIFKEFSRLRKEYKIRIDCIQDQVYTGLKGFLYKNYKYLSRMDKYCIRLKDFIYISVDGDVLPCCALNDYKIANLLESDLKTMWRSKKYNNFRKNYYKAPWCSRCDFAKLKQINSSNLKGD